MPPVILIGTKIDLVDERVIQREEAEQWCKDNGGLEYFETSAFNNTNVEQAFMAIGKKALDFK